MDQWPEAREAGVVDHAVHLHAAARERQLVAAEGIVDQLAQPDRLGLLRQIARAEHEQVLDELLQLHARAPQDVDDLTVRP